MKTFLIVWIGQAFSLLGSQLVQFALVWWLTKSTGSATVLALATLLALLPQIIIGPFAGAVVDRWSRRWIMLIADAAIAVATLLLAGLFWLDLANVWSIYGLILLRSTGAAFHWPAMQASTTMMVPREKLARVAGLNQTLAGVAGIFIPPLGALAMEALPMQAILVIDVVTAVPAVATLLVVSIPQPVRQSLEVNAPKSSVWADLRQGFHFILGWKGLMMFSVIGLVINIFGRAAASLTPLLVTQHFLGGVLELGWFLGATGFGTLAGGLILGLWGGFKNRVFTMLLGLILDGLAIILISFSTPQAFGLALVAIFCVGFLETIVIGLNGAIFQAIIPPDVQGRVFALLMSLAQVSAPLGLIVAGPFADRFGITTWWMLTGLIIGGMGVAAFFIPSVVRIEEKVPA